MNRVSEFIRNTSFKLDFFLLKLNFPTGNLMEKLINAGMIEC